MGHADGSEQWVRLVGETSGSHSHLHLPHCKIHVLTPRIRIWNRRGPLILTRQNDALHSKGCQGFAAQSCQCLPWRSLLSPSFQCSTESFDLGLQTMPVRRAWHVSSSLQIAQVFFEVWNDPNFLVLVCKTRLSPPHSMKSIHAGHLNPVQFLSD